jgi:hypothetical protein
LFAAGGVDLTKPVITSCGSGVTAATLWFALDAIGTCGKWGQSVPSSGGSHGYVFLEPNEAVGVGGR